MACDCKSCYVLDLSGDTVDIIIIINTANHIQQIYADELEERGTGKSTTLKGVKAFSVHRELPDKTSYARESCTYIIF